MKRIFLLSIAVFVSTGFGVVPSFQGLGFGGVSAPSGNGRISGDGQVIVFGSDYYWSQSNGFGYLDVLPRYTFSHAADLSYDGSVIVGSCIGASGPQAFRWSMSDGMVGLGVFSITSNAYGVSADGSVVVGRTDDGSSSSQAFRWTEVSGMEILGDLRGGGYDSTATAVSADGSVVVGQSISADGHGHEAFIFTESAGMVGLGSLDSKDISSWATAVSADGTTVVGTSESAVYVSEAFRSYGTGMIGLGSVPGYNETHAYDVSGDGSVIVGYGYQTGTGNSIAMIWDIVNGMRNLNEVLVSDYGLDLAGWTLVEAAGISDDGLTIFGKGVNPDGFEETWIASVPEPCTVLLLGFGGLLIRKRQLF